MADDDFALIPISLLTGFLGSGKTTVLNNLVTQEAMRDALVIINEFGDIPLDHMLVAHSTENIIMEMGSGCLCCTIRGDLVQTLRDIVWRFARDGKRQFKRVFIETTGLADPAPILHTLMTDDTIINRYRFDGMIATFDYANGMATLDTHEEAVKQAAMADVILLTKGDLVDSAVKSAVKLRLQHINPAATYIEVEQGEVDAKPLLNLGLYCAERKSLDVERWLKTEAYGIGNHEAQHGHACDHDHEHDHACDYSHEHGYDHHHEHRGHDINRHDDHIRAFSFSSAVPLAPGLLESWIEVMTALMGSNILRVKGILNIQGEQRPVVIHGVQHIFHPPVALPAWPSEDKRSRLVFITKDIERETIERTFRAFEGMMADESQ